MTNIKLLYMVRPGREVMTMERLAREELATRFSIRAAATSSTPTENLAPPAIHPNGTIQKELMNPSASVSSAKSETVSASTIRATTDKAPKVTDPPATASNSTPKAAAVKSLNTTLNHVEEQSMCVEVHCVDGPLHGGLNNQLMGYFGLALLALGSDAGDGACICLPDISYGYPKGKSKVLHKPITEDVDLAEETSWWDPALPRIHAVDAAAAAAVPSVVTHSWETVWRSYKHKHVLRRTFFEGILSHPSRQISAALKASQLPDDYIAIHARVERDIRESKKNHFGRLHGRNISSILDITRNTLVDQWDEKEWGERVQKAMEHVLVAVGTDILEEDRKVLEHGRPPWGSNDAVLKRIDKPSSFDYWSASLLDMIVCVHATVFVGFYGSTFSENVAYLRNDPKTTFKYNSASLEGWDGTFTN